MAEEKEKIEVTILSETVVTTRPTPEETVYTIYVTYQTPAIPAATVAIPATEVDPENPEEVIKQFREKKGPLYEKYKEVRANKIREHIKTLRLGPREKITV